MASPLETGMKFMGLAVVILFIYLIVAGGVTLAYYFRTGSGTTDGLWYQDRQKWIPKSWIRWAGFPATFSNISGVRSTSNVVLKTMTTGSSLKACMLECDGSNDRETINCLGFMFNPTSNACTLYGNMNGLIPDTSSSNVLYIVNGLDAYVKQYFPATNKAPSTSGYAIVTNSSIEACSANCSSNSLCTGFTFTGTSCGLYSDMDDTKFTTQTGVTSYPLKDHAELTSASDVKYWKRS